LQNAHGFSKAVKRNNAQKEQDNDLWRLREVKNFHTFNPKEKI
jgi:hypothetical protein